MFWATSRIHIESADMNSDNSIDVLDIISIVNIILGLNLKRNYINHENYNLQQYY